MSLSEKITLQERLASRSTRPDDALSTLSTFHRKQAILNEQSPLTKTDIGPLLPGAPIFAEVGEKIAFLQRVSQDRKHQDENRQGTGELKDVFISSVTKLKKTQAAKEAQLTQFFQNATRHPETQASFEAWLINGNDNQMKAAYQKFINATQTASEPTVIKEELTEKFDIKSLRQRKAAIGRSPRHELEQRANQGNILAQRELSMLKKYETSEAVTEDLSRQKLFEAAKAGYAFELARKRKKKGRFLPEKLGTKLPRQVREKAIFFPKSKREEKRSTPLSEQELLLRDMITIGRRQARLGTWEDFEKLTAVIVKDKNAIKTMKEVFTQAKTIADIDQFFQNHKLALR